MGLGFDQLGLKGGGKKFTKLQQYDTQVLIYNLIELLITSGAIPKNNI